MKDKVQDYKTDPIEKDPRYKEVFSIIDDEVEELLKDDPNKGKMGWGVYVFDMEKKDLLKSKYDIEWRSIAEMNPDEIFD